MCPDGAKGTEPRTWMIARYLGGSRPGSWNIVRDEDSRALPGFEVVRVVEQQPPTEGRAFTEEQVERGAVAVQTGKYGTRYEVTEDARNLARRVLTAALLSPGPPEPTQGNEWDRATVDAVVELADSPGFVLDGEGVQQNEDPDGKALAGILAERGWPARSGHHLRRLERKLAASLELLERFKGAARDTGGRSDG